MDKKCLYCGVKISPESVIDFCQGCGISHFGSKMFKTIIENMESANARGDLNQGSVE